MKSRVVQTSGIGKVTTAHLNLTRTMADVVADKRRMKAVRQHPPARMGRPPGPREQTKITYAGFDPEEVQVQSFGWGSE